MLVLGALAVVLARPVRSGAIVIDGSYGSVSTRIAVKLAQRLSSQDNRAGDVFAFALTGSVAVEGMFLSAGTIGHGVVLSARSGEGPKSGALVLEARSVDLPGGGTLAVGLAPGSLDRRLTRESRNPAVPPNGAIRIALGTAAPTNVVYEKGTPFVVVAPPPETPAPDPDATP